MSRVSDARQRDEELLQELLYLVLPGLADIKQDATQDDEYLNRELSRITPG